MDSESSKGDKDPIHQETELPFDLITETILTRLPIKSIARFKSVSKLWYSTLSSPPFAFAHFKFHRSSPTQSFLVQSDNNFQMLSYENGEIDKVNVELDFDVRRYRMSLVGTCNGLVCLGSKTALLFIVWNPITREFRKYSNSKFIKDKEWLVTWGFGYVSATNDYKIIGICKRLWGRAIRVVVFSTRFNKWRRIDNDFTRQNFSDLRTSDHLDKPGLLVNETLYWMTVERKSSVRRKNFSFDLSLELFDTFPHLEVSTPSAGPTGDDSHKCYNKFLCVVKGCLLVFGRSLRKNEWIITVMKNHGVKERIVLSGKLHLISWVFGIFSGVRGSNECFTECYAISAGVLHLGVMDLSSSPRVHTLLTTYDERSEIAGYSASLISP